jgi:hypothetical protein
MVVLMSPQEDEMAVPFDSVERKRGDLYLVQSTNGKLYVGNGIEKTGDDRYRVYFSFQEGPVFDSSIFVGTDEIRQVIRNGVAIWFNRG